jgi:thiol:disulfide interchange protein
MAINGWFLPPLEIWTSFVGIFLMSDLRFGAWLVVLPTSDTRVQLRPVLTLTLAIAVIAGFWNLSVDHDGEDIAWQVYSDQRLEQASGRPELIAFAADWCINHKAM